MPITAHPATYGMSAYSVSPIIADNMFTQSRNADNPSITQPNVAMFLVIFMGVPFYSVSFRITANRIAGNAAK